MLAEVPCARSGAPWVRKFGKLSIRNKGDFCLRMLELFLGFSGFRTFHRNKFELQKLITRTSKEDYPSTGCRLGS